MLRLAARLHAEPPCEGVGILRVESEASDEHERGMAAFARRMGFAKAPFGRARELGKPVRVNAWLRRRASRFDARGFGEILTMGAFASASLEQQRRAVMAPPEPGDGITLVGKIRILTPLAIGDSVGEALNARSSLPVIAFDDKAVLMAGSTPSAIAVIDWVEAALRAGTLRFDERADGFTFLAPGDPRLGRPA